MSENPYPYDFYHCCGQLRFRKAKDNRRSVDSRIVCLKCGRLTFDDGSETICEPKNLARWRHYAEHGEPML